jgi:hypothetical protein
VSTATTTATTTVPSLTIMDEDEKVIPTDHPSLVVEQQQQQQYHPPITPVTSSDQLEDVCIMSKGTDNTQSIVGRGQLEEGQMMMQGTESLSIEKQHSLPVFSLFLSKSKRVSAPIECGTVVDQMVDVYVDVDVDVCRLEVSVSDDTVRVPFSSKRVTVSDNSIGMKVAVAAGIEVIDVTDESKDALEEPEEQCDDNDDDDDDANGDTGFGTVKENIDDDDEDEDDEDDVRGSRVRRSKRIRRNASAATATTVQARYSVDNHHVTPDCTTSSSTTSSSSSSSRASRRIYSGLRGNSSGKPSNAKANLFFLTKVGDTAITITIICCILTLPHCLLLRWIHAWIIDLSISIYLFFIGTAERARFEAEGGGGSSRRGAAETAAGGGSQGEGGAHPQRHRAQQTGDDIDANEGEC